MRAVQPLRRMTEALHSTAQWSRFMLIFIHPLSNPLNPAQGRRDARAYPRMHWAKGRTTPWTGPQSITAFTCILIAGGNFYPPINQNGMSSDCGRKPEVPRGYPCGHGENLQALRREAPARGLKQGSYCYPPCCPVLKFSYFSEQCANL